jgi:hypothetical protein
VSIGSNDIKNKKLGHVRQHGLKPIRKMEDSIIIENQREQKLMKSENMKNFSLDIGAISIHQASIR